MPAQQVRACCLSFKLRNLLDVLADNPHYFLFRGKPTILITSTEHYGAVLNADFDYVPYLKELQSKGFNQTRVFPARLGPVRDWIAHYERFWDDHLQRLQKQLSKRSKE